LPKGAVIVIQIYNVRPVAHLVAGLAGGIIVKELRMLIIKHGIGRGMVIYNVYHAFHAARVYFAHKRLKIVQRAVFGVNASVITVGIRAAECTLLAHYTYRMNRHEPYYVRTQRAYAVKVARHGGKGAFRRMVAHINGIYHLLLQGSVCFLSHL